MDQTQPVVQKILRVVKALLAAYILTAFCLVILAFLLLKLDLSEANVNVGIIVTYLLSCFLGGFILGKTMEKRKFIWGMALGAVYFLIVLVISTIAFQGNPSAWTHVATTFLLCMGGGMAGGMVS
ncbi:MAG TPA: TIGR04086 family membrane protein [Candidatus Pelethocola excrementipullorum]|nr:TIGR04086 family membrane protein [Candidatus Pelethocola excrementipullorum]